MEGFTDKKLEKKDDFEKQFERYSTLTIDSKDREPGSETVVRVTSITPPEEKIKNAHRLVFAEAFAHPLKVYGPMLGQMYEDGRPTLTFDHPRAGGELPELSQDEIDALKGVINVEKCPEEVRGAQILLGVLRNEQESQVDMMTHSRGSAYTVIAALIDDVRAKKENRENRIRNIVSYGPAGLVGGDRLYKLVGRVLSENFAKPDFGTDAPTDLHEIAREIAELKRGGDEESLPGIEADEHVIYDELVRLRDAAKERGITEYGPLDEAGKKIEKQVARMIGKEGAKHIFGILDEPSSNPGGVLSAAGKGIARTFAEARGLAGLNLTDAIIKVRELGVGVAIVRGSDDRVFPPERIAESMKLLRDHGVLDVQITGAHDTIDADPRAAHILEGFFNELEKQRNSAA